MSRITSLFLTAMLCLLSFNVSAEGESSTTMTNEEYQMVSNASADYTDCTNEYAMEQLGVQPDFRVIADHAMKECSPILETLYNQIVENGHPPEFASRYASSISNRSANKLLSRLMTFSAAQGR